jgi:CBS domain-containing protein
MRKQVLTIDSSLSIKDAAKMMSDSGVGCLVITEKNVPVGILTERDFATRITAQEKSSTTYLRDVMSSPLISISPESTATKLAELMKEKKIHKVPVLEGNQIIGIVTATDLIRKCVLDSDLDMKQLCSSFAQMAF